MYVQNIIIKKYQKIYINLILYLEMNNNKNNIYLIKIKKN